MKKLILLVLLLLAASLAALLALKTTGAFDTDGATAQDTESDTTPRPGNAGAAELTAPDEQGRIKDIEVGAHSRTEVIENPLADEGVPVAPGSQFVGRVLDPLGNPIAEASVYVEKWRDGNGMRMGFGRGQMNSSISLALKDDAVTTDREGKFRFPRERSLGSKLSVQIHARGFQADPFQHMLDNENVTELGDFFLVPGVIIAGQVLDEHLAPVFEASVRRVQDRGDMMDSMLEAFGDLGLGAMLGEVETDENGRFDMPHEKAGKLVLSITHDAHLSTTFEATTPEAGGAMTDIQIELPRGGVIEGRVTGFPEGRRGVSVAARELDPEDPGDDRSEMSMGDIMEATLMPAGDESAKVAADGSFRLEGLQPEGRYELRVVEKQNFVEVVPLSEAVEVQAGTTGATLNYDAGATVSFQVVDADSGKPIEKLKARANFGGENQVIRLTAANLKRPKSFPDGKVTLYEVRPKSNPDTMTLEVESEGYFEATVEGIVVGANSNIDVGKVKMQRAPRLRFVVLDAKTKEPIHRAAVALIEQDGAFDDVDEDVPAFMLTGKRVQERTGRSGRVELAIFDAEVATLRVRSKGHAMYRVVDFALKPADVEHTIYLSTGASVQINVSDPSGNPVPGALVYHRSVGNRGFRQPHKTNGEGQVVLEFVEAGEYQYRAVREGSMMARHVAMADEDSELAADDWELVDVRDGDRALVELRVPGIGTVHGIVTSRGRPLEGARVSLMRADASVLEEMMTEVSDQMGPIMGGGGRKSDTTEANGLFRIENVSIDSYKVRVRHPNRAMPVLVDIAVGSAEEYVEIELPLTSIEGVITSSDGSPIAGARVAAENSETLGDGDDRVEGMRMMGLLGSSADDVRTDADGNYLLEGVASGRPLRIRVKANGFVPAYSKEINLDAEELRTAVNVRMDAAGSIHVKITESDSVQSLAFVRATWAGEGEDTPEPRMILLRSGRATITELQPGKWKLRYSENGNRGRSTNEGEAVEVEVVAGEQAEATIEV